MLCACGCGLRKGPWATLDFLLGAVPATLCKSCFLGRYVLRVDRFSFLRGRDQRNKTPSTRCPCRRGWCIGGADARRDAHVVGSKNRKPKVKMTVGWWRLTKRESDDHTCYQVSPLAFSNLPTLYLPKSSVYCCDWQGKNTS